MVCSRQLPHIVGWKNDCNIPVMGVQKDVLCFTVDDSHELRGLFAEEVIH